MSETPRPLWELGLNWHTPWFGGARDLPDRDIIRIEAKQECARELWAALRAHAEELSKQGWSPRTVEAFERVLGVPPKEPAQKETKA